MELLICPFGACDARYHNSQNYRDNMKEDKANSILSRITTGTGTYSALGQLVRHTTNAAHSPPMSSLLCVDVTLVGD